MLCRVLAKMTLAAHPKVNSELFNVLSTRMKVLFYIGLMEKCSLSELREATKASWTTINKIIPELYRDGFIEITEVKTTRGSIKKVVKLSRKGSAVFNKLLELNDLLNSLDNEQSSNTG